jgi:peptide/nickel transport system substrate-binding protein
MADIDAFQSAQVGSPVSVEIGNRLVATMTENLVFIGTVQAPGPIYHRNVLKNFPDYLAQSDEFRWAFPYRPQQWFLDE